MGFFASKSGRRIVRTCVVDKGDGGCDSGGTVVVCIGACFLYSVQRRVNFRQALSTPRPSTVPENPILLQPAVRVDNGDTKYSP